MSPAAIDALYAALAAGDETALLGALGPGFHARFADGMPVGGGEADSPRAAKEHWWAIGGAYRVRPEVEELIACDGDRWLAVGTYRGTRRADGATVEARFTHLWTVEDGTLVALEQITDTARW